MNKYGQKIRELRLKNNDRLEDLAKKIDTTLSALGKYERGEVKISPELLEKIAEVYEEPLSYFYGETKELPKELQELGEGWVAFAKEMEDQEITPEEIKAIISVWRKMKGE